MQIYNLRFKLNNYSVDLDKVVGFFIKPFFVLFMYFAVFGRFEGLFGLTGGMTAVLIGFGLFVLAVIHLLFLNEDKSISQLAALVTIFFILLCLSPFLSFLVYDARPGPVFIYSAETFLTFTMFFSVYYFTKTGLISPRFFFYTFALLGAFVSVQLVVTLAETEMIRRLTGLGGGLNYVGSSLAMCSIVWVMIIYSSFNPETSYKTRRLYSIICFVVVFLVLILTGTRAGLLAFIVGLFLLQVFGMKSSKFTKYALLTGLLFFLIFLYIASNIDLTRLFNRFTYDDMIYMAEIRFDRYARSVTDLTLAEYIVGRPDLYTFDDGALGISRVVNTHNLFLSLIRYNGLLPFILFIFILFVIFSNYFKLYIKHQKISRFRVIETAVIILLIMALIYSMFSGGRTTRIFIVFIQLGFTVGYFELLKSIKTPQAYKDLIV